MDVLKINDDDDDDGQVADKYESIKFVVEKVG